MFGLIDAKGNCFIKANEENKPEFIKAGGEQHSRMPYYSISEDQLKKYGFVSANGSTSH